MRVADVRRKAANLHGAVEPDGHVRPVVRFALVDPRPKPGKPVGFALPGVVKTLPYSQIHLSSLASVAQCARFRT